MVNKVSLNKNLNHCLQFPVTRPSGVISSLWRFCTVNRFQYITCAEIHQTPPEQCFHWLQSDWMMSSNCLKHHKQWALPAGCVGLPVIMSRSATQRPTMTTISETNAPPNIKDLTQQLSNYMQSLIQGVSSWKLKWMNQRWLLPAQVKLQWVCFHCWWREERPDCVGKVCVFVGFCVSLLSVD